MTLRYYEVLDMKKQESDSGSTDLQIQSYRYEARLLGGQLVVLLRGK